MARRDARDGAIAPGAPQEPAGAPFPPRNPEIVTPRPSLRVASTGLPTDPPPQTKDAQKAVKQAKKKTAAPAVGAPTATPATTPTKGT